MSNARNPIASRPVDPPPAWAARLQWAAWAAMLAALLLLVRALPVGDLLDVLKGWVGGLGPAAPAVFAAVYAVWAAAFLPGAPMTLAAGALFGLGWGVVAAITGATAGAALAFLIARYVARERVRKLAESNPKLAALDEAVGQGGWKIVAMLRLSPAFPFNLQNYFYGVTPIGFWTCTLTSALFMLPGCFLYVYLGHVGAQGLAAASGGAERSAAEWALLAVGLVATAAVTVYITRLASRALREKSGAVRQAVQSDEKAPGGPSPRGALTSASVAALLLAAAVFVTVKPDLVRGLFGPPQVAFAQNLYPENPDGETFDHAAFDRVVSRFVDEEGMVDYIGLRANPGDLDAYIASLAGAPFDALKRREKLALLVNAYNAFTLRLILDHYPVDSIRDIPGSERWDARRWTIAGETYSLNDIEHREIRPRFAEPRIHFALVCAAYSCPKLRTEAYTGDRLDAQLEEQTRYTHRHPKWFRFDADAGRAELTKLYDWYAGDFKSVADSPLDYAARYVPELRRALDQGRKIRVDWIDYDWSLNSQRRP